MAQITADDLKRRYAQQMYLQGMDASPIQHWTQGLARLAQGAIGGYQLGQMDREDQAATDALKSLPGLSPVSGSVSGVSPVTPATETTQPVSNVKPMAEALTGRPAPADTSTPATTRMAQALTGKPSVMIPPDVGAYISKLMENPRTQAQGLQLYSQYAKPADYGFQTLPDGTILRTDSRSGTVQPIYRGTGKPTEYGFTKLDDGTIVRTDPRSGKVELAYGNGDRNDFVTAPDGTKVPIPPGVDPKTFRNEMSKISADAAGGKMTETQAKSSSFAARMEQAEGVLGGVQGEGTNYWANAAEKAPLIGGTAATNWMQSEKYQQYRQAKSAFITAMLRQESGAAINKDEFNRYDRELFPQPGDSQAVIQQKAVMRATALEQMRRSAGPAYRSPTMAAPATAGANKTSSGISWSVE